MADTLVTWALRGYADNQEHSPWKRAPVSFDDWCADPVSTETSALQAYWDGFNAAVQDAFAKACREEEGKGQER